MYDNFYFVELLAREKQQLLEMEALRNRQVAEALEKRPGLKARLFRFLGERPIAAGEALKRRYQQPEPVRSCRADMR